MKSVVPEDIGGPNNLKVMEADTPDPGGVTRSPAGASAKAWP